ncbi:hypothetical protein MPL3356_60442 [Mesorhizobium plurifarium]|uniref:Uncharacterized protein n=1 Tax=Mesorhizobium plurifarium TaxID=69974 RepID=A0A090E9I0_MESPL|nr:hypothetical protein MPL3356_60442 [Mesorhizobium plurifarium]
MMSGARMECGKISKSTRLCVIGRQGYSPNPGKPTLVRGEDNGPPWRLQITVSYPV